MLIWGALAPKTAPPILAGTRLHAILTGDEMCRDLAQWRNPDYLAFIDQRRAWTDRLFAGLSPDKTT